MRATREGGGLGVGGGHVDHLNTCESVVSVTEMVSGIPLLNSNKIVRFNDLGVASASIGFNLESTYVMEVSGWILLS
jgi:hypothetical protein